MFSRAQKIDRMMALNLNCKSVVKTVFGGTDDSAQKAQKKANTSAQQLIEQKGVEARGDALSLSPASDENRNLGLQAALDVLGQSIPQQLSTFQQGNVGAQQALLSGLPQQQNAILGLPADLSGLQPQAVQFDPGFLQQQLPNFITSQQALDPSSLQQRENVLSGITSDQGLFRAASLGQIPNISEGDQEFFAAHLAAIQGRPDGLGSRFINNPMLGIEQVVNQPGGFNRKNEGRLANLLTQFQGLGNK
jgi:hypothetical protein